MCALALEVAAVVTVVSGLYGAHVGLRVVGLLRSVWGGRVTVAASRQASQAGQRSTQMGLGNSWRGMVSGGVV